MELETSPLMEEVDKIIKDGPKKVFYKWEVEFSVREPNPISDPVVAKMNSQIEALKAKQKRIKKAANLVARRPEILELMDVLSDAKEEPKTEGGIPCRLNSTRRRPLLSCGISHSGLLAMPLLAIPQDFHLTIREEPVLHTIGCSIQT